MCLVVSGFWGGLVGPCKPSGNGSACKAGMGKGSGLAGDLVLNRWRYWMSGSISTPSRYALQDAIPSLRSRMYTFRPGYPREND
eukprot:4135485-Pyramimonas_sp.AAC.1